MADHHVGSSFDSFLEEEGILDEVKAVARSRILKETRASAQRLHAAGFMDDDSLRDILS
jgi:hypothetical protein